MLTAHRALRPIDTPNLIASLFVALGLASPALCAAAAPAASQPVAAAPSASARAKPLISLLLPLDAPDFSRLAAAVQQGCESALSFAGAGVALEVARTTADAASIRSAWSGAAARGAAVIVGPMTRNGVTALAAMLAQPERAPAPGEPAPQPITLTLNAPEEAIVLPPRLHTFGLVIEQEARAAARMAWIEDRRSAVLVQAANPLARRTGQAFAAEWLALGGRIAAIEDFDPATDLVELKARLARHGADMTFLAADAAEARRVRPYLDNQTAVYATSQVNDRNQHAGANVDLAGIRFVDMPWMLQPDHPAVMVYPRPADPSPELQRFYALGIDACRIAGLLLEPRGPIEIDGVTGKLSLLPMPAAPGSAVAREPLQAAFPNPGLAPAVPPGTPSVQDAPEP